MSKVKRWLKCGVIVVLTVGLIGALPLEGQAGTKKPNLSASILNIAHRGASGYAPEHTIPAYALGQKMKGDYIEIDLQMTKDGHLIAMHDETVDRTTNGTGRVKDMTLAEIKKLDAGSWFNEKYPALANPAYVGLKVSTLEEVIHRFGRNARYYIETKAPEVYPGMEEELLRVLKRTGLINGRGRTNKVIIQSFSQESLLKVHQLNPRIPLVQLLWYETAGTAQITDEEIKNIKRYAVGVGPNYDKIDQAYVSKVRQAGLEIHPYTVNEPSEMKKLIRWGVTGMFTNYPDRLHRVLREVQKD
ncbi:glycerophosphodiester phosphodiesterase [Laceyella tengchongensis]|uniref:glycerophosphodiester phosphodiesterase n=1 Tax=Laceyella tengchongensis TaxID=574699 RepID=UPI0012B9ACE0|nr:glycerophosphodiester phosphodiesterase [Laceyella tengchongensis]